MSQLHPSGMLRKPSARQRQPSQIQRRPSAATQRSSMSDQQPSTPNLRTSLNPRGLSPLWPSDIPPMTPMKSVSPKEYLTALSNLLSYASNRMAQIDLPSLIWAFNRAHARNDRIAMRQLGTGMLATLNSVQDAYHTFCETRGTFDEEEIWKMVMNLGDEGEGFWDVVDELGDLIEIMEGEETEGFWVSLEGAVSGV